MSSTLDPSTRTALLLTATIDPGETPLVARTDPSIRLADYVRSLEYWIAAEAFEFIVFCENSGHDLSVLKALAVHARKVSVEFISTPRSPESLQRGKGLGELKLIEAALQQSIVLKRVERIAKCTGRLRVANAPAIATLADKLEFDVMCNLKHLLTFADSRFFIGSKSFYDRHLALHADCIDDRSGVFFEHALARAVHSAMAAGAAWQPLPLYPAINGVSGTHGVRLDESHLLRIVKASYHKMKLAMLNR